MFNSESNSKVLTVSNSYFYSEKPSKWNAEYSCADDTQKTKNSKISYEWTHTLSDIITSLISAGLEIEFLHEHPFCAYGHFSTMKKDESGLWRLPPDVPKVPLLFSLKAVKK